MVRRPLWPVWILITMSDAREARIRDVVPASDCVTDLNVIEGGDLKSPNTEYDDDNILGETLRTYSADARNEIITSPPRTIERRGITMQSLQEILHTHETVLIGGTDSEGDVGVLAPSGHIRDFLFGQTMRVRLPMSGPKAPSHIK